MLDSKEKRKVIAVQVGVFLLMIGFYFLVLYGLWPQGSQLFWRLFNSLSEPWQSIAGVLLFIIVFGVPFFVVWTYRMRAEERAKYNRRQQRDGETGPSNLR